MTRKMLEAALECWERGWSIIPIRPEAKRPSIRWRDFQERQPTEEEITDWWTRWPENDIAIVTGAISGIVVVDCDNNDALHTAFDTGMRSPIRARTRRGCHLYFAHPRDGVRRGPRAGVHTPGHDWPRIPGLDFRGDGSYALLPPSRGYAWDIPSGLDFDDMPVWQDWRPALPEDRDSEFQFEDLDLSGVRTLAPEDFLNEWDRTAKYVRDRFPTTMVIPSGMGNGRNERVMRHISDCILEGVFGDELLSRGYAFMREFFAQPLPDTEFRATVSSMESAERRNHPERFDEDGRYIYERDSTALSTAVMGEDKKPEFNLIEMADAEDLLTLAKAKTHLIEPWLPPNTIVQVYGYSGHGKSLFIAHALAALGAGRKYFGPFDVATCGRVLYLDFENGMATLGRRLLELRSAHGDTKNRLKFWAPFVDGQEMNLYTQTGMAKLQKLVEFARPDVVVIDTVRSAWPGLQENSADAWSPVNQVALRLRNSGVAVILVHHANKPNEGGMGREAGSTNQLTVLETQIRVSQVCEDAQDAKNNAGIFDGDYDAPVWPQLRAKLPAGFRLYMVSEIRYGKVREWSDAHDRVQWIGYAVHDETDERLVVSSRSTKQRAKDMALDSMAIEDIATTLGRPLRLIREWLEIDEVR